MAKIEKPKARKGYKCSKCGEVIKVGDVYLKGTPFRRSPVIRCTKCGLRRWELSSSEYVQNVGRICDCWEEDHGLGVDTAQEIVAELTNVQDMCQDSLDNMPEGLQEGDTGQLLQERIDNLESAISDLEAIDYDSIKEGELGDSDYASLTDEAKEEMDETIKSSLREEIESALSCLDY